MEWKELRLHTTREAVEPIANLLNDKFDISGVVIEDPLDLSKERESFFGEIYDLPKDRYPLEGIFLKFYLPIDSFIDEKVENIKEAINLLQTYDIDLGKNELILNRLKEEDWETAWKKYYKPTKISNKITIVPTWEKYEQKNDDLIIELDPGMAFGTGTHPTTKLSIQALEKYIKNNDEVIDVGCGSGILSIASGLLGAKKVHAFDLDIVAVNSTALNCKLNNLKEVVHVKQNNLLDDFSLDADIVVANILAEIIVKFSNDAWKNLKAEGLFITSGIIKSKENEVVEKLKQSGFTIIEVNELKDWVCIVAKKEN